MKNMRSIFKNYMFIFHSKANLDEKTLFGKITHHLDPEIKKMQVRGKFGNTDTTFNSGL